MTEQMKRPSTDKVGTAVMVAAAVGLFLYAARVLPQLTWLVVGLLVVGSLGALIVLVGNLKLSR